MARDVILLLIGLIVGGALSGFFSWLFTACYYNKSLKQQSDTAEQQIQRLTKVIEDTLAKERTPQPAVLGTTAPQGTAVELEILRQKRIEECIAEYRRAGTPVRVIDTYSDLKNEEKAELLDLVLLRARGRPAKHNKYRVSA